MESNIGKRLGKLTVVSKTNKRYSDGSFLYECKCDCGKTTIVKMHTETIVISVLTYLMLRKWTLLRCMMEAKKNVSIITEA